MTDPNAVIPPYATPALWRRYDAWRGRRHQRFTARTAHMLPRLRNRRGYRRLVVFTAVGWLLAFVGAIAAFAGPWFFPVFLVGLLVMCAGQSMLRIVTGAIVDAPVSALDEIQLAQRNSARSLAYITVFSLMFIPYVMLIVMGIRETVPGQWVYGTAVVLIVLMTGGAILPGLLTAWWMDDPDPEDADFQAPATPARPASPPVEGSAPTPPTPSRPTSPSATSPSATSPSATSKEVRR